MKEPPQWWLFYRGQLYREQDTCPDQRNWVNQPLRRRFFCARLPVWYNLSQEIGARKSLQRSIWMLDD